MFIKISYKLTRKRHIWADDCEPYCLWYPFTCSSAYGHPILSQRMLKLTVVLHPTLEFVLPYWVEKNHKAPEPYISSLLSVLHRDARSGRGLESIHCFLRMLLSNPLRPMCFYKEPENGSCFVLNLNQRHSIRLIPLTVTQCYEHCPSSLVIFIPLLLVNKTSISGGTFDFGCEHGRPFTRPQSDVSRLNISVLVLY